MGKVLKVGIAPAPEQRARMLDVVAGRVRVGPNEPRVWFPSIKAATAILSDDNMALLKAIREGRPRSIGELATVLGRGAGDLVIPLRDMAQIGLIRLHKREDEVVPEAIIDRVLLHVA